MGFSEEPDQVREFTKEPEEMEGEGVAEDQNSRCAQAHAVLQPHVCVHRCIVIGAGQGDRR